ncbi:MAG: hypothetical protein K6F00_11095 [Lachnospiraceae bacterium]|nr:hypothetical protein [Lachnospiraceae bacterium]
MSTRAINAIHTAKEYKTASEIRTAFIKDGWSESIKFFKIRLDRVSSTLFMMDNGNIYDSFGKIYRYNIACIGQKGKGKLIQGLTVPYYGDDFDFVD